MIAKKVMGIFFGFIYSLFILLKRVFKVFNLAWFHQEAGAEMKKRGKQTTHHK